MKSFYSLLTKFTFLVLAAFVVQSSKGQTVLSKGDLAFTGYIGNGAVAGTDEFSFVLLRAISAGTVIKFTENGWLRTSPTAGSFRTGEGTLQFTSVALPAGAEIRVVCSATPTATFAGLGGSAGTLSILAAPEGNGTPPAFSANGDQIIAYQGASTSPTFITAIHMNVYSVSPAPGVPGGDAVTTTTTEWDGSFSNAVASGLPSGSGSNFLTNGVDAIWIPGSISAEVDNARFSCAAGPLATIADIRAAVFNASNWTTSDGAPGFTLPTSCNYIGVFLPVQLISFQAKNNLSKVDVQWQVANQQNVSHYEVERSFDNQKFEKIGQVAAQPGTGQLTYDYSDVESLKNSAAIIYYRLKSVDLDGKFSYSDIVNIRNKKSNLVIDNLSNPVKNNLVFTLTSKSGGPVQVQLTDVNGRILATRVMQVTASSTTTVTMPEAAALAQGMYLLKVVKDSETTVARFIK